jgi:hypothetical protein
MTLTKSVVIVWTIPVDTVLLACITSLKDKLAAMAAAGQTDGKNYWFSPQITEYRFTDQAAAEEFVYYLTQVFPCNTDIDSMAINNI